VNDAFGVGCVERIRNLDGERQDPIGVEWPTTNAMLQRHPVQKLHGDEYCAVLLVNFVDRADIWVIQGGGGLGFALKAAKGLGVFGYVVRQELEGYKATEFDIFSFVDHAHSAAAQLLDNAEVRDGLADHWRESYGCGTGKSMKAMRLARSREIVVAKSL
jgi:hypothetical protein